jgi:hypothetical protein
MIKKILVSACLLLSVLASAQESSYSPYSFYGVGDLRFKGTTENRSMGGLTIFPDSIHLNIQNPASYSSLKLVTFSVGGTTSGIKLNTETEKESAKRTTLDYFSVGVPIGKKIGAVFGLMPYSSVGFNIRAVGEFQNGNVPGDGEDTQTTFVGDGGISRVFLGAGYQISKNWRIGAQGQYNFGKISTTTQQIVSGVQSGTQEVNNSEIRGFSADLGLMYEGKLTKKLRVFSGVTYTPEASLNSNNFRSISIIGTTDIDTIKTVANTKLKLPAKLTFGLGIGKPQKWQAGAEISFRKTKDQTNRFEDITATFENSIKYSVGGYYIPNYNSFSSYLARITYRAGARYENTGLILNTESIYDSGVTGGVGLPLSGTFSNINIGLEYGKRGTVSHGLVAENYFNVSIGFSFNDHWFQKRRYD